MNSRNVGRLKKDRLSTTLLSPDFGAVLRKKEPSQRIGGEGFQSSSPKSREVVTSDSDRKKHPDEISIDAAGRESLRYSLSKWHYFIFPSNFGAEKEKEKRRWEGIKPKEGGCKPRAPRPTLSLFPSSIQFE